MFSQDKIKKHVLNIKNVNLGLNFNKKNNGVTNTVCLNYFTV